MKKHLAPSLLASNFYNLESELKILKKNNVKYIHLDVMDGMFVPNISFGIPVIKKIKEHANGDFIFDTHLMIENPDRYISDFKKAGADILTVHKEATNNIKNTINMIKKEGMLAGVSIKPNTKVDEIDDVLDIVDLVLVMSVEPGFGGQKFMENSLDKVRLLKSRKDEKKYNYIIEIDGGVNKDNAKRILDSGVELLVTGSAVFNGDIDSNIKIFNDLM